MPTQTELLYLEQGYHLPAGFSWEAVAQLRKHWGIDGSFVPVAVGPGCVGWSVPFVDGRPLMHGPRAGS